MTITAYTARLKPQDGLSASLRPSQPLSASLRPRAALSAIMSPWSDLLFSGSGVTRQGVASIGAGAVVTAEGFIVHPGIAAIGAGAVVTADGTVSSGSLLDGLTPAIAASVMGTAEPTYYYSGQNPSGAVEVQGVGEDLTDSVAPSPTKQVYDAILNGVVTYIPDGAGGSGARMEAATSGFNDITTQTITEIWIGRILRVDRVIGELAGKRGLADGFRGRTIATNFGKPYLSYDGGSPNETHIVNQVITTTDPQVWLCKNSSLNNESGLWTRYGSSAGPDMGFPMNTTEKFAIGDHLPLSAWFVGEAYHGAHLIWEGTAGNGFTESHRKALAVYLQYESP